MSASRSGTMNGGTTSVGARNLPNIAQNLYNNALSRNSGGGYQGFQGMAPGPYSNVGSMMMGQNPYQQTFGGGYQGMYNSGSQSPAVNQNWYNSQSAQNPTATPGQTAFPDVNMQTGQLLNNGAGPTYSPVPQTAPQTSFTPQAPVTNNLYGASDEYLRAFGLK